MKSSKKAESVREMGDHRIASGHGNLVPGTWEAKSSIWNAMCTGVSALSL